MKISGPCNISRKARTYLKVKFFRSLSDKTYLAMFWLELGSLVAAMGRCGVGVVRQLLPRQVGERGGHSGAGGTTLHRQLHASSSKPRLRSWPSYLCKGETGVKQGGFVPVFLALNCGIEWRVKKHDEMPKQVAVYSTYVRPLRLLHVAGTLVTC